MRFIENPDLREWVKESLRRAVFQKAHELAVQTGCEVLVKLQDTTDRCGQYYATRTLHLQYQGKGLSKQPWDVKVSGVTGLPEAVLVEKGCQSGRHAVLEEGDFKMEEEMIDGNGMMREVRPGLSEDSNQDGSCDDPMSQRRSGVYSAIGAPTRFEEGVDANTLDIKVEEQNVASQEEACCSSIDPDNSDTRRESVPQEVGQLIQGECETEEGCTSDEQGPSTFLGCSADYDGAVYSTRFPFRAAATYPIGFPINKLQALTKSVDATIQTPFPSQILAQLEGMAQNPPPDMAQSANQANVVVPAQKPYQCGICRRTFGSIQILSRHAQMNHGLDRRMSFHCDVCGQSYKLAQHLQRHMRMHQAVMPYICSVCNRGFFNGTSLVKHERGHERLKEKYQCMTCMKLFQQVTDLQEHCKHVHSGPEMRISNQDVSLSEMPAVETQLGSSPEGQFAEVVTQQSPEEAALGNFPPSMISLPGPSRRPVFPQNMHIPNDDKSDSVYPSSKEEQSQDKEGSPHMSWQDAVSGIDSDSNNTPTSSAVGVHSGIRQPSAFLRNTGMFSAGQPSGLYRFNRHSCHICGKSYKYNFTLKEHLLTHASVPQFVCKICGTAFTRQRQLRDHMFRHSGTYPYHCELCGKGFIRPSTMKRHQTDRHRLLHNDAELVETAFSGALLPTSVVVESRSESEAIHVLATNYT